MSQTNWAGLRLVSRTCDHRCSLSSDRKCIAANISWEKVSTHFFCVSPDKMPGEESLQYFRPASFHFRPDVWSKCSVDYYSVGFVFASSKLQDKIMRRSPSSCFSPSQVYKRIAAQGASCLSTWLPKMHAVVFRCKLQKKRKDPHRAARASRARWIALRKKNPRVNAKAITKPSKIDKKKQFMKSSAADVGEFLSQNHKAKRTWLADRFEHHKITGKQGKAGVEYWMTY